MEDKKEILERFLPIAVLKALTPAALQSVSSTAHEDGFIPVRTFPFRIGRESRVKIIDDRIERIERVKTSNIAPNNEIYLIDNGHLLNISREHFQIEKDGSRFFIYDRGSACGTRVNEKEAGLKGDDTVELFDNDIITVGTKQSPYQFKFILVDGYTLEKKDQK